MGHLHGDPKPSMLMQRAAAFHVLSLWNAWWKCAEMHIQTSTFAGADRVNREKERERERKLSGLTHANLEADYFASATVMMWQFICEQAEEERNGGWEKECWGAVMLGWTQVLVRFAPSCQWGRCQMISFKKGLDTQKSERHLRN